MINGRRVGVCDADNVQKKQTPMPRFSARAAPSTPCNAAEQEARDARRVMLEKLMSQNGGALRDDSRLAHQYILHGGDVQLVAQELLTVNFLYENTRYNEHCQKGLRQIANQAHVCYPDIPWSLVWSVVREYGVPAMKFFALAEANVFPPNFDIGHPPGQTASA